MAELKLPFHFTVGKDFPADQVEVNFETLRKLVQDLDEKVEAFNDLVVSGTFENTGKLTTTTGAVVTLPGTLVNTDKLQTDTNGNVLQANQPNFLVELSGTVTNVTGASTQYTIIYDTEIFDINADFNTTTGTFTAPVTGRYYLAASFHLFNYVSTNGFTSIKINTSNRSYENFLGNTVQSGSPVSIIMVISLIVDMDANDTATIIAQVSSQGSDVVDLAATDSSWFSGSLIN